LPRRAIVPGAVDENERCHCGLFSIRREASA
jgi:hypothetical protein